MRFWITLVLIGLTTACGGGSSPSSSGTQPPTTNNTPTISGSPLTTMIQGQSYSFTPIADDADGDALTFSIIGNPGWLSINSSTGSLSGTPGNTDIGTTTGITITVSDGTASASLPPFTLIVTAIPQSSATIRWVTPTTNADGSALGDLAGFRIFYGNSSGSYPFNSVVDSPAAASVVLQNLAAGTWFFSVKAVDSHGNESSLSAEVSKVITP